MRPLRLRAPAKINWTLEVLGKREDGYHEVRTILQTIALSDVVTMTPGDGISLSLTGNIESLAGQPLEANLAHRAARLLQRDAADGVRIELEKRVPIAAGLGGGSTDAAAVLRGLRILWRLDISDSELASAAAQLGSDVPFFLRGGTAFASGRGEVLDPLPDCAEQRLLIAYPSRLAGNNKTANMYASLRASDSTDGSRSQRLAEAVRTGEQTAGLVICNAFEQAMGRADPAYAQLLDELPSMGGPHLCGSGPAIFYLLEPAQPAGPLATALAAHDMRTIETETLTSANALAIEELA
jgi:4-diphosphocytidyl-2-C-methyl-D-erythritol kinase